MSQHVTARAVAADVCALKPPNSQDANLPHTYLNPPESSPPVYMACTAPPLTDTYFLLSCNPCQPSIQSLRRALEGREKVLGAEHPATVASAVNLATILKSQGKEGELAALQAGGVLPKPAAEGRGVSFGRATSKVIENSGE